MRVRHDPRRRRTTITGWDGRRTIGLSAVLVAAFLQSFACALWELPGWPGTALALAGLAAAGGGSGYRITIDARDVRLTKTWCAIPYRRLRLGRDCEVSVADDLDAPEPAGVVFRRAGEDEDERTLIGTARDAAALASAIRDAIDWHRSPIGYRA